MRLQREDKDQVPEAEVLEWGRCRGVRASTAVVVPLCMHVHDTHTVNYKLPIRRVSYVELLRRTHIHHALLIGRIE